MEISILEYPGGRGDSSIIDAYVDQVAQYRDEGSPGCGARRCRSSGIC